MSNSNPVSTTASTGSLGSGQSWTLDSREMPQIVSTRTSIVSETLEDHKTVVRDDLGPIPEVTVEFMLDHIAPNSNIDVEATMRKLKEANMWPEESRWKAFEGHNPEGLFKKRLASSHSKKPDTNGAEMEILSRVKDIYNSIILYAQFYDGSREEPTMTFEHFPSSASVSNSAVKAGPNHCGALTIKQETHTKHLNLPPVRESEHVPTTTTSMPKSSAPMDRAIPNWFDTACVWTYKIDSRTKELNDNVLDMVWSLQHIMQVDHRRRFIFGITAENEDTRIWFTCRQILFVTRPFNFSTNASQLVQLIASLAYATPTQLGYDPTMKLWWRDNGFQYDIECTTKRPDGSERTVLYCTQKVLSHTAYNLRGRATRVYLAMAVDRNNPFITNQLVVLKDAWINADRPKEGDTLSKLLEGASEEERKLFLTAYQYGVVQVDNQDDSTQGHILKHHKIQLPGDGILPVEPCNRYIQQRRAARGIVVQSPQPVSAEQSNLTHEARVFHLYNPPTIDSTLSASQLSTSDRAAPPTFPGSVYAVKYKTHHVFKKPIVHSPKVHYRIVYEDVGDSLLRIANSGQATTRILCRVMSDITKALKYMATKGYIHRDVSPGNILWFGDHAKLSDLEFAREYEIGTSSDAPVGTYNFMAGEVLAGKYSVDESAEENASIPFVPNPIHDLESLWWVGVWGAVWYYPVPFDKITLDLQPGSTSTTCSRVEYRYKDFNDTQRKHIEQVRKNVAVLFPSSYSPSAILRMEEIYHETRFGNRVGSSIYPEELQAFNFFLDIMRECISWAYKEIQSGLPRREASYFVDVLRIGDPTAPPGDKTAEGNHLSIYDRILEMLDMIPKLADLDDGILWPLDSIEEYSDWVARQQTEMEL